MWFDGPRYTVRRSECWGDTYVWSVYDRQERKRVTKYTSYERTAGRQCDRLNAGLESYRRKRQSEYATP